MGRKLKKETYLDHVTLDLAEVFLNQTKTMRCKNIECSYRIRVNFNQPDENGIIYTEAAVKNAYNKSLAGLPIMVYPTLNLDEEVICGTIKESKVIEIEDNYIVVEITTTFPYGGTCETVTIENNVVRDFDITSFSVPCT